MLVQGKLKRDIRIDKNGNPAAGGRLFLRGEIVSIHLDYAHLLEGNQADLPKRTGMVDKQTTPDTTKGEPPRLQALSLSQLKKLAKEANVPGYTKMAQAQLVHAMESLREAEDGDDSGVDETTETETSEDKQP